MSTAAAGRPPLDLGAIRKGVPLKRRADTRDLSSPMVDPGAFELTHAVQSTVLDINIEAWYHLIPDVTFKTAFFELTPDDGRLFIEGFLEYQAHCDAGLDRARFAPSAAVAARIDAVAGRLQTVVDEVTGGGPAPVFVKTSCRSAKDAPTSSAALTGHFARKAAAAGGPTAGDNELIGWMLEAGLELLKTHTAKGALELFVRSERVYQDMLLALEHLGRWKQHVAVRAWADIDVAMEFRGFVSGGVLTALSQYNHLVHFPALVADARGLRDRIAAFFCSSVRDRLTAGGFADYVVDFAVTASGELVVIELNPFLETTDGCLFQWTKERALLEGVPDASASGKPGVAAVPATATAPEFRVRTRPEHGAMSLLAPDWRAIIDDYKR